MQQRQRRQQQGDGANGNNKKTSSESSGSSNKKKDEKPWPKSVVYTAYAAGATLIPYTCVWMSLVFPPIREKVWSSKDNRARLNVPQWIRKRFGEEDYHSVAYVDVLNDEGITDITRVPYRLPGEGTVHERATEINVEDNLRPKREIRVELLPLSTGTSKEEGRKGGGIGWLDRTASSSSFEIVDDGSSQVIVTLPASLAANNESLIPHLPESIRASTSTVAVEFPDDDDENAADRTVGDESSSSTTSISFDDTTTTMQSEKTSGDETIKKTKDPLLRTIHTYSTWYYQQPLEHLRGDGGSSKSKSSGGSRHNHVTSSMTNEEIQIQTLEADVKRLEAELRNLNATRPYDDIQEELDRTRATLRRLKWKRWVPW